MNQINTVFEQLDIREAFWNVEAFLTALVKASKASQSVKTPGRKDVACLKCLSHSCCLCRFLIYLCCERGDNVPDLCNHSRSVPGLWDRWLGQVAHHDVHPIPLQFYHRNASCGYGSHKLHREQGQREMQRDSCTVSLVMAVCVSLYLAALESLSPEQKAELLLDPSTGALENETMVK